MNILNMILDNDALVGQVAKQLNMNSGDAQRAMQHMLPALTRGVKRNISQDGGLEGLLGALASGGHQKYVDSPELLGQAASIQDGNAILGHVLGSKDVSRNVAGHAAQQTGLDHGLLKKMLPMLATAMMGSLSKQGASAGMLGQSRSADGGGGLLGGVLGGLVGGMLGGNQGRGNLGGGNQGRQGGLDMLNNMLDSDGDGSALDDILGMAKKFF